MNNQSDIEIERLEEVESLNPIHEWLLFSAIFKLFGVRPPMTKKQFLDSVKKRHSKAIPILKKIETISI